LKVVRNIVKENDGILSVQPLKLSEVAKLRGDGTSELIRGELPKGVTMNQSVEGRSSKKYILQ